VLTNPLLYPKTILVPLNITHQAIATESILQQIQKGSSIHGDTVSTTRRSLVREMLYELLTFFASTYKKEFGFNDGPPVHDPLAIAALLPFYEDRLNKDNIPNLEWKFSRCKINVVQQGERRGQTEVQTKVVRDGVYLTENVNIDKFWKLVFQAVDELDKSINQ
jgi:uridine nucleosidase